MPTEQTTGRNSPRGRVVAPPASAGGHWGGKRSRPFGASVPARQYSRPGRPDGVNETGDRVIAVQPKSAAKGRDAPCSCHSSGRPGCVARPRIGNHPPLNTTGRASDRPKMEARPLTNNQQRLWSTEYAERGKPPVTYSQPFVPRNQNRRLPRVPSVPRTNVVVVPAPLSNQPPKIRPAAVYLSGVKDLQSVFLKRPQCWRRSPSGEPVV